jgi:hypothetical protein
MAELLAFQGPHDLEGRLEWDCYDGCLKMAACGAWLDSQLGLL